MTDGLQPEILRTEEAKKKQDEEVQQCLIQNSRDEKHNWTNRYILLNISTYTVAKAHLSGQTNQSEQDRIKFRHNPIGA